MKRFSFRSSIIPPYRQKGNRLPSSVMQPAAGVSCITGEGRGGGIWIVMSQKLSQNCL